MKRKEQMFLFSDNGAVMQTWMRPSRSVPLEDIGMLSGPRQADPFRVMGDKQGMLHVNSCSAAIGSDFSKNENKMSTVQKRAFSAFRLENMVFSWARTLSTFRACRIVM